MHVKELMLASVETFFYSPKQCCIAQPVLLDEWEENLSTEALFALKERLNGFMYTLMVV